MQDSIAMCIALKTSKASISKRSQVGLVFFIAKGACSVELAVETSAIESK